MKKSIIIAGTFIVVVMTFWMFGYTPSNSELMRVICSIGAILVSFQLGMSKSNHMWSTSTLKNGFRVRYNKTAYLVVQQDIVKS